MLYLDIIVTVFFVMCNMYLVSALRYLKDIRNSLIDVEGCSNAENLRCIEATVQKLYNHGD